MRTTLLALLLAAAAFTARAGTVGDDFNDNIKNTSKWGADEIIGHGVMKETGGRLEYSCPSGTDNDDFIRGWIWSSFPYNSDWEMQMDVVNTTTNLLGSDNSFGIKVRSPFTDDNEIFAELYGSQSGGPAIKGFHSELETSLNEFVADTGDLGVITGAVRMVFNSSSKVISVFYDLNPKDGYQWVQYGSFGLAGSGGADGNADWGMSDSDRFPVYVYGYSQNMNVPAGQLAADNFLITGSIGRFDALIAELQARSALFTGSTNKTEISQKKAIDKTLVALLKPSTSLATDLKNAGTAVKNLQKVFPTEFPAKAFTPNNILSNLLLEVFNSFHGDISAMEHAAQESLDSMPASSCKDKAQAALDKASADLAASGGTDFASVFKAVTTALKDTLKGQSLVQLAQSCKSKSSGGGGGGTVGITALIDGAPWSTSNVSGQVFSGNLLALYAFGTDGSLMTLQIPLTPTPIGTHYLGVGSSYAAAGATNESRVFNASSTATLTKYNPGSSGTANGTASGTFTMTVRILGVSTNVITSGTFNVGGIYVP
jgi:hypothetical protein